MFGLSTSQRAGLYIIGNLLLLVLMALIGAQANAPGGQVIYLFLMLAVCTSPILLMENLNGAYVLLGLFLAVYFTFFAAQELVTLLHGESTSLDGEFLSATEGGLLLGAVCTLVGYLIGVKLGTPGSVESTAKDWSRGMLLVVGVALWLLGAAATLYVQVWVVPEKTNAATARGLASMGAGMTFLVMLGALAEPLGILILAYAYARFRTVSWLLFIIVVVVSQVILGFVCDIKSLGMLGGILVILAKILMDNKLPKAWLLAGVVFIALVFPLFQAYRSEVTGERGMTRTQAVENIGKVIDIVLASRQQDDDDSRHHTLTFLERASLKGNVERAVERTGVDTPFQEGRTMVALATAFIPRLLWPDKPDVAVGQEFNHTFIHGEADTYISPSHFGELYWNFGWPGIVFGMGFIGVLLGFIGARCSMSRGGRSVTRFLILLVTAKYVCLGFEGSIAIAYVTWMRSLLAIWILHLMLARRREEPSIPMAFATAQPG